jgi:hypothetical protein
MSLQHLLLQAVLAEAIPKAAKQPVIMRYLWIVSTVQGLCR